MIETLKQYDALFIQNNSHGDEKCESVFEFCNRSSQLILSAPHSTRSFVSKKEKIADLYVGAIVKFIGIEKNISTLIRTKYTPYKALISDYIANNNLQKHYFLDIHGFNQDIGYDICLGIGEASADNYPKIKDIINIAQKYNLKIIVNHPNYTGINGLTGRYHKIFKNPNVIQIEIKKYLRDFYANPDVVENITLPFLRDVVDCY